MIQKINGDADSRFKWMQLLTRNENGNGNM